MADITLEQITAKYESAKKAYTHMLNSGRNYHIIDWSFVMAEYYEARRAWDLARAQ